MEAFAGFSELVDHRVFADSARAGDDDDELIRRRDDGVGCEGGAELELERPEGFLFGRRWDWLWVIGHFEGGEGVSGRRSATEGARERKRRRLYGFGEGGDDGGGARERGTEPVKHLCGLDWIGLDLIKGEDFRDLIFSILLLFSTIRVFIFNCLLYNFFFLEKLLIHFFISTTNLPNGCSKVQHDNRKFCFFFLSFRPNVFAVTVNVHHDSAPITGD